jgi:hypothetical protein
MSRHRGHTGHLCGADNLINWIGQTAAQLARWYPQFTAVDPPAGSSALRAWQGVLQPLESSRDLRGVFAHFEQSDVVTVLNNGSLEHPSMCKRPHGNLGYESLLIAPFPSFRVLLLDFGPVINPQVFCLSPEISRRRFPAHPHLRNDQRIFVGRYIEALCLYLASDNVMPRDEMALARVLDFTSFFLAKHTVWARSLRYGFAMLKGLIFATPDPGGIHAALRDCDYVGGHHVFQACFCRTDARIITAPTLEDILRDERRPAIQSRWPGPFAPHSVDELLAEVEPNFECPCGKGRRYEDCCMHEHEQQLAEERRQNETQRPEAATVLGRNRFDAAPEMQGRL